DRALPVFERTLAIRQKTLGEQHPDTAQSQSDVAFCLRELGQEEKALPLFEKALDIRQQRLGEEHPDTAIACNNLAVSLWRRGRVAEAVRLLQASLPGQVAARYHRATSGFDRPLASGKSLSPHELLALGLARLGLPGVAGQH